MAKTKRSRFGKWLLRNRLFHWLYRCWRALRFDTFAIWMNQPSPRRKQPRRGKTIASNHRLLRLEALESRSLLSAPDTLAALLPRLTPDPHPSGDQPADASQETRWPITRHSPVRRTPASTPPSPSSSRPLRRFTTRSRPTPPPGPPTGARTSPPLRTEYRLHLDDNGMLVRTWTIDWGDGSDPQTVSPQPWVIHQYPAAGQYTILVSATSPDGTFSAGLDAARYHRMGSASAVPAGGLQVTMAAVPPTLHVADTQTVAQGQTFALDNLASFSYLDTVAVTDGSPTTSATRSTGATARSP